MFCSTRTQPLAWPGDVSDNDTIREITGTFDFKWPHGTEIRVAFLRTASMSDTELNRMMQAVMSTARLLIGDEDYKEKKPNIRFSDPHLFDEKQDYDVLVSLEALPALTADGLNAPGELIQFPRSELGTYSRRVDWGRPTMYLGRPELTLANGSDYWSSAEFTHSVLHEFGHVLGLPHAHQSPFVHKRMKWKTRGEILNSIESHIGRQLPDLRFIEEQITGCWPISNTKEYSEWWKAPAVEDTAPAIDSVMTLPMYRALLQSGGTIAQELRFLSRPSIDDRELLLRMYPSK